MAPEEKLQRTLVRLVLLAPVVIVVSMTIYAELNWKGYWALAPAEQPIAFPHDLHAGKRGIECQYCHRGTQDGYGAGVPSVTDCYQCHQGAVKDGSNGQPVIEREQVKKLIEQYVEQRRDLEWFKYYDMPEHVKFAHKPHINYGFECAECHGNVAEYSEIVMKQKPTMGWCVACHRENEASVDCTTCHR